MREIEEPLQTTSKAELHEKKIMLPVWWDWKGMVFLELLPRNQMIDSDVYYHQLNKLNATVKEKRLYSPDLAPSDYYLFRSLPNSLNGKTFNDDEAVKSHLLQFFADKDQKFYERGIMKLPERWQKVIEQNGKYIIH